MRNVQRVSKRIIDDMDGISLSFNDIAFINDLQKKIIDLDFVPVELL